MRRPLAAAVPLAVALALAVPACDGSAPRRAQSPAPRPTLPDGPLRGFVLQPGDVQRGLVALAAQTGAADVEKIASFSADPAAAERSLVEHGFRDAYVVQYADPDTRAVVTNVVTRFATEAGAQADLAADIEAAKATGQPFEVIGLGEQAGGVRGQLDPRTKTGSLVTLRWRMDDTTWLLAVGAPQQIDEAGVRRLADLLVTRFRPVVTSPSPS